MSTALPAVITPDRWIIQMFSARAAAEGGMIRRQVADVERLVGRERFLFEVRKRGVRLTVEYVDGQCGRVPDMRIEHERPL